MILVSLSELAEISAPAPDANDKVRIIFGVLLRIKQAIAVYGIELKLMTAEIYKCFNELRYLFLALFISEHRIVQLHSKRAAVAYFLHIKLGERLNYRQGTVELSRYSG